MYIALALALVSSCKQKESLQKPRIVSEEGMDYLVQDSILITTRDGSKIAAIIVRSKKITQPESTLLYHTIYARKTDIEKAKKAASRGYIGIVTYTRGKGLSSSEIVPYEYEAEDVYDVIDWISKQAWSNKKVGMYGGSYVGFVQWASLKHQVHPALKTIVPSVAAAPGIAEPMENGVIPNFFYPWPHYVTNNKYLDSTLYFNRKRWANLNMQWYEKGTSYRSMDSLDGLPNPIFRKWLEHPIYDSYWQKMMPYKDEFAHIDIPVLTTTGYYDGGQIGALHYLKQHYKYNKKAQHYLLIGPYLHFGAQGKPDAEILGYTIDPVAKIDITGIIFDWFDYIFKKGKIPDLLKDKINYQVMGANKWGHASSLETVANDTLHYRLNNSRSGVAFESTYDSGNNGLNEHYSLDNSTLKKESFLEQKVDFSDRGNFTWNSSGGGNLLTETLTVGQGFSFTSAAFETDFELNGSFHGTLNVSINKKDFDYTILLYEQTPEGKFFSLSLPYVGRASHAHNIEERRLLTPNKKTSIPYTNVRMTSRKFNKGSRIVVVLNIIKHPFNQINYGSGKKVSDETMADAKEPLIIKWYNDSIINIPINKNEE